MSAAPPGEIEVRVIRPPSGWPGLGLGALWRRRGLLLAFLRRDIAVHYQQTVFGPLWLLIQPLVTMLILALVFSSVARIPTGGVPAPLFFLVGTIMWSYFAQTVTSTSHMFKTHELLLAKIRFPYLVLPVASALANLIGLSIQLAMLALLLLGLALQGQPADLTHLWVLPLALLPVTAAALGAGLIVASMTATYRDLVNAVPFALQSGFLLTPVLYSYAMVPPEWRATYALLNPLSVVSDLWRHALAGSALVSTPRDIGFACLTSLLLLLAGLALFQHGERAAMKDC